MNTAYTLVFCTVFFAARGPGYLAMVLALVEIFSLEWIVKLIAYLMDRYERRKNRSGK